jgi:hypothetical protein
MLQCGHGFSAATAADLKEDGAMPSKRKGVATPPAWRPPAGLPPIRQGDLAGPITDLEQLMGPGEDLWADDVEFEAFLAALRRWRREDREARRRP